MGKPALHRAQAFDTSAVESELIGFAASSADAAPPTRCDSPRFAEALIGAPPVNIEFDTKLLEVAEEIYKVRRKRDVQFEQLFGEGLFCEPAWDVLLDLYINHGREKTISVSSACLASAAPTSTALRHVSELVRRRLVVRSPHPHDRRVFVLQMSQQAVTAMETLLSQHFNAQGVVRD
jgi:DNA-binding MarR family transcriptional regulator